MQIAATWREQGVVSAFTRFHPLLHNAWLATSFNELIGSDVTCPTLVPRGETVSIDCTLDDDEALAGYAKVLRQEVASARRSGLLTTEDEGWSSLDVFVRLYRATMDRSGAAQRYYIDGDGVLRLRDLLNGRLHLLVTRLDDVVAAACLFTEHGGIVQAFLVGTNEQMRALSPLKVLLDDARRWARARGSSVLHLGGGRAGRHDSLFAFKKRFSPRRHQFYTGQWVLDAGRYNRLSQESAARGLANTGGFFPTYRGSSHEAW